MVDGKYVGQGVAFKVLDFLTEKFNFTINIVPLGENIIGSKTDYSGSLVECLNESVCITYCYLLTLLSELTFVRETKKKKKIYSFTINREPT